MYFSFNETSYSCNYFILDHTVIHNTKKSLFLLSNNLHFATHLKKKKQTQKHCTADNKKGRSFSINGRNIERNENLYRK